MPSLTPKSVPVWTRSNTVQPHGSHCAQDLLFPLHGLQLHKLCLESGLSSFLPLPAYTASPVSAEICAALLTGPKFADSLSGTPHLPFYPDSKCQLLCFKDLFGSLKKKLLAHSMFCYFLIALFHVSSLYKFIWYSVSDNFSTRVLGVLFLVPCFWTFGHGGLLPYVFGELVLWDQIWLLLIRWNSESLSPGCSD